MSRPTLVTGATGFAGTHLLRRLAGIPVVAWQHAGGRARAHDGAVQWQQVDITDVQSVDRAIAEAQPSRIVHLAGAPNVAASWGQSATYLRINALGTAHLLDAVRRHAPDCRVLVISSGQIYQPSDEPLHEDAPLVPVTPYGFSKLAQDQLALQVALNDGLAVIVARPFNHAGPGQDDQYAIPNFAHQLARIEREGTPAAIRVGNLDARRDITDVRDVVEAYARLVEHGTPGRAYNVCSGRAWRIGDLLAALIALSTASVTVTVDPRELRPHDVRVVQGDPSRIAAEFGWTPRIEIEQTLRETLDWWRARVSRTSDGNTSP